MRPRRVSGRMLLACVVAWVSAGLHVSAQDAGARASQPARVPAANEPEAPPPAARPPIEQRRTRSASGPPAGIGARALEPAAGQPEPPPLAPGDTAPGDTAPGDTAPGDTSPEDIGSEEEGLEEGEQRTDARQDEGVVALEADTTEATDPPALAPAAPIAGPVEAAPRVEHHTTERHTETRFVPLEATADAPVWEELYDLAGVFGKERSFWALLMLLAGVLVATLVAAGVRRMREKLPAQGLIPTALAFAHLAFRLLAVALALALVVRLLPPRLTLMAAFAFAGFAIALGWSARDVLPDLTAGFLIAFERRVRRGMWLVGEGFAGQVERVGARSTLLIDVMGRRIEVPNRHLMRAPLTSDASGDREHEVLVRFETPARAEQVRAALRDAVLSSPWVYPGSGPVVLRDPDEPWLWRVRGRLLDPTLVSRFEGDLLERAEEILEAFTARGRRPHDPGRDDESSSEAIVPTSTESSDA